MVERPVRAAPSARWRVWISGGRLRSSFVKTPNFALFSRFPVEKFVSPCSMSRQTSTLAMPAATIELVGGYFGLPGWYQKPPSES